MPDIFKSSLFKWVTNNDTRQRGDKMVAHNQTSSKYNLQNIFTKFSHMILTTLVGSVESNTQ